LKQESHISALSPPAALFSNQLREKRMNDICNVELTQEQYDDIRKCESVIIREYENVDGSRFAKAVAWGDAEEMQLQADTPSVLIVPVGVAIVCQRAIPVAELKRF
jgi:hypothetical protein